MNLDSLMNISEYKKLAQYICVQFSKIPLEKRYFLGITGIPASGKSTMSLVLAEIINREILTQTAIVVPMDGYHLPNNILKEKGLYSIKGAPETFDAKGFVEKLERLHDIPLHQVKCPAYDRKLHGPVHNAIVVQPEHRIIIVEGNYLLLNKEPWNQIHKLMDEIWYLDCPKELAYKRLLERHVAGGRTIQEAKTKIKSTDIPNANIIAKTRNCATRIITIDNT